MPPLCDVLDTRPMALEQQQPTKDWVDSAIKLKGGSPALSQVGVQPVSFSDLAVDSTVHYCVWPS